MAKYRFVCPTCNVLRQENVSLETKVVCIDCHSEMDRQLPTLNGPSNVTEIINKQTGVAWRPDQKDEVKQRREEYYWSVEVPRFVASGTYSIETMMENEWIWLDDDGHIQVYNKPPHKR